MIPYDNSLFGVCAAFFAAALAYFLFIHLSRLLCHPLRNFPGPRLAAITFLYEAYYEIVRDGDMVDHLEKLHEKYGPIVRVTPDQLHFSDPRAYADIYNSGVKFVKDHRFYTCFALDEASFGYTDPRKAKIRRDILSPLFSRHAVLKLETVVQQKINLLLEQLLSPQYVGKSVNMSLALRSTSLDIITSYCFGHSYGTLTAPNFEHPIIMGMVVVTSLEWVMKHFPFVKTTAWLPKWITRAVNPSVYAFSMIVQHLSDQIDGILADPASLDNAEHETIYHHLMTPQPSKGQPQLPSKKSLREEATNLIFAGSDTVSNACMIGLFNVVNDRAVYARLVNELDEVWPEKDSKVGLEKLEKLPYLTAVIKESLRLSYGVIAPLPRVVGPNSSQIAGVTVPAGVVVSVGISFMHNNADIFPDPFRFSPERWLQPNSKELERYLNPFSKGPRSCIGLNLAWCELYLILGNLFRHIDFELDNTRVDDLKCRVYLTPVYRGRSHAFVKGRSC